MTSLTLGLPSENPVIPGGPDVIRGANSLVKRSTYILLKLLTPILKIISLTIVGLIAKDLWQDEKPSNSVQVLSNWIPNLLKLFQIISADFLAFSIALGPDIVNCPDALYPLKYEIDTLNIDDLDKNDILNMKNYIPNMKNSKILPNIDLDIKINNE